MSTSGPSNHSWCPDEGKRREPGLVRKAPKTALSLLLPLHRAPKSLTVVKAAVPQGAYYPGPPHGGPRVLREGQQPLDHAPGRKECDHLSGTGTGIPPWQGGVVLPSEP